MFYNKNIIISCHIGGIAWALLLIGLKNPPVCQFIGPLVFRPDAMAVTELVIF